MLQFEVVSITSVTKASFREISLIVVLLSFPHHFEIPIEYLPLVIIRPVLHIPHLLLTWNSLSLLKEQLLLLQNLLLQLGDFLNLLIQQEYLLLLVLVRLFERDQYLFVGLLLFHDAVYLADFLKIDLPRLVVNLLSLLDQLFLLLVNPLVKFHLLLPLLQVIVAAYHYLREVPLWPQTHRVPCVPLLLDRNELLKLY